MHAVLESRSRGVAGRRSVNNGGHGTVMRGKPDRWPGVSFFAKQREEASDLRQRLLGREGEVPSSLAQGYAAVAPHRVRSAGVVVRQGQWSPRSRRDWKAYDPFESLARQQTHLGNTAAADVLQGSTVLAKPDSFVATPPVSGPPGVGVTARPLRRPAAQQKGGRCAVQGYWAQHPEDCLRQVYGSGLRGTKFARLGPPQSSSTAALNRERRHIASEISDGLLSGAIQVRQGSALAAQLERARKNIDSSLAAAAAAAERVRAQDMVRRKHALLMRRAERRIRRRTDNVLRAKENPSPLPPPPRPPSPPPPQVSPVTLSGTLGKLAASGLGLIGNILRGMGVSGDERARAEGSKASFKAGERAARSFYDGASDARSVCVVRVASQHNRSHRTQGTCRERAAK